MGGPGIILICVFTPLLGAFLLPLLGRVSGVLRNMAALLFVLVSFVCSALLLLSAQAGEGAAANAVVEPVKWVMTLPLGFSFGFLADGLAVFMAMISSFVAAIIVFYSFGYMLPYANKNEYYMMVVLFIGAMMGLVYSTNLLFIYVFWEIAAICCWRLIGFFREKPIILKADKAFLVTVGGALIMLIGFLGLYQQTGTFDLLEMDHPLLPNWVMIAILFGILSKSATLPLHTWLPDAGVAPSPVTSLLHAAVLVKIGVYVYARFFLVNFELAEIWYTVVPVIAAVSALVSAGAAIVENNIKRIIAYSTVSQLAFIFLGLSCGVVEGVAGGLLYILMHSLAKGGLFLCAGIVEHSTHTKDIRQMGGLVRCLPATTIAFACCAFSVMGIPPFGGFFSKFMVINGALLWGSPWLPAVFLLGALMTIIYLARVLVRVFFGQTSHPHVREGTWEMVGGVTLLAALSLLAGIFIQLPTSVVAEIIKTFTFKVM
jgi:NADH:ubiquinone oxidoreductase subunit 5 (subunit L)/multisubunit Na+/H+ antiporter MnhA subunit